MIELVWDQDRSGTGTSAAGRELEIGDGTLWPPEDLLALAVASCLMRTLVRLADADGVDVLGYVASARAEPSPATGVLVVELQTCVVARSDGVEQIRTLCVRAREVCPIAHMLGDHLTVTTSVRVVEPGLPAEV